MNLPVVFLALILFVFPSFAQQADSTNTFHIRKKYSTAEDVGTHIFRLFRAEAIDTLVAEYFPEEETAKEICREGNLSPESRLYLRFFNNYNTYRSQFTAALIQVAQQYNVDNVPFPPLKIDSITVKPYTQGGSEHLGTTWQPLTIYIHCSAGTFYERFEIFPLFPHREKWYIMGSNLNFTRM